METINLSITGMTCGNCVKHVEKALRDVPGVQEVEVDLTAGTARVLGDFSKGTAPLIDVLSEEGYPAQVKASATAAAPLKAGGCKNGGSCGCH
jgi:copper chaperone CopZ